MAQSPFHNDPFGHPTAETTPDASAAPVDNTEQKSKAVDDLLRSRQLTTSFGQLPNYTVHTNLSTNRHAWHYRCSVVQHGIEETERFPPVFVDRTVQIAKEPITEGMRRHFALEAVDKHFAKCAEVEAYLASLPPPQSRHLSRWIWGGIILSLIGLAAYAITGAQLGWWPWHLQLFPPSANPPLPSTPSPTVRWARDAAVHQVRSGQSFSLTLPTLERTPPNVPVDITLEAQDLVRNWLRLEQSPLRLSGTAPIVPSDMTYTVSIRARVAGEADHSLRVDLTIARATAPPPPSPPPHVDEGCLLKRIRGEPC